MHELSIVMGIIEIATREAEKAEASVVEEIELDIGRLSTVEPDAFEFAWKQGIRHTPLENAVKKINRPEGKARCLHCENEFPVAQLYDACPACGEHWIEILAGKELRVRSIIVS